MHVLHPVSIFGAHMAKQEPDKKEKTSEEEDLSASSGERRPGNVGVGKIEGIVHGKRSRRELAAEAAKLAISRWYLGAKWRIN
jgi:hypothetical protein